MMASTRRWYCNINLASRYVLIVLLLLSLVQIAGYLTIDGAVDEHVESEVAQTLDVAGRVWNQLLDDTQVRFRESAEVLASDFGFRSAVASGDVPTIRSALANNAGRIGASIAFLVTPEYALTAASEETTTQIEATFDTVIHDIQQALRNAGSEGGSLLSLLQGQPAQFVIAPIKAPRTIGYVLMGFTIDDARLEELKRLTAIDALLVARDAQGTVSAALSTLPDGLQDAVLAASDAKELRLDQERYQVMVESLPLSTGKIQLFLLRSFSRASERFDRLQGALAQITILGMFAFGLGAIWSARKITQPLVALTKDADAMSQGDFDIQVQGLDRSDEIGILSRGVDHMRLSIKRQQGEIRRLAFFDPLTDLPNRVRFAQLIQEGLDARIELAKPLIVLTINMDRFKQVNDVLGYEMGDRLLKLTANRIDSLARRTGDTLARIGGDEFALLLSRTDKAGAWVMARRIQEALHEPLEFDDTYIDLSVSIGIAAWPDDADTADTLVNRSQIAMYAAKSRSEDIVEYRTELDTSAPENLGLLSELRRAVNQQELRLYLQPKIATATRQVVAGEALIRWQHPERGMVAPFKFVPFAEQTGFVRQLTRWMFDEAARIWSDLQPESGEFRISVNLSTRDLMEPTFPDFLSAILQKHGVPSSGFCLEITESAIMDDPQLAEDSLRRLSQMGFRLSIDDFGTGYSSLGYLKRLPIDELKIDQSFVFGMLENENDAIIVKSTIDLAHNLGLEVVAEGVETAAMLEQLALHGCEEAQGYYIAKPMTVSDFTAWRSAWLSPEKPAESQGQTAQA